MSLKDCEKIAAENPDLAKKSPSNSYQYGTNNVHHILSRQFREALVYMATRLNAELIIRRIHYIRSTEEATIQFSWTSERTILGT